MRKLMEDAAVRTHTFNNKIKFSATLFQAERDIELENCAISEITPPYGFKMLCDFK